MLNQGIDHTLIHRDIHTNIFGSLHNFTSTRVMNNIWVNNINEDIYKPTTALVVQKGGHDNKGLAFYKMDYSGKSEFLFEISDDFRMVSDGFLDGNSNIYIVYSTILYDHHANIYFTKLGFDPASMSWFIERTSIVFHSDIKHNANRATITKDESGNLWCAFRMYSTDSSIWTVKVYVSHDDGITWQNNFQEFGLKNGYSEKNPRITAMGDRVGLVYTDVDMNRFKYNRWTSIDTNRDIDRWQDVETITRLITKIAYGGRQYWLSHWSLSIDNSDNLHLAYEDKQGIYYCGLINGRWMEPIEIDRRGEYPTVSISSGNTVLLIYKSGTTIKICDCNYSENSFSTITIPHNHSGKLRTVAPANFDRFLPVLYEVDSTPTPGGQTHFELLYSLLEVNEQSSLIYSHNLK